MKFSHIIAIATGTALMAATAHAAPVSLGGYNLDSDNFATGGELRHGGGRIFQEGGPGEATAPNFDSALAGPNARDGFMCETDYCEFDAFFEFGANNEDGDDIVLFGLGAAAGEVFDLIINGTRVSGLSLVDTGEMIAGTDFALTALAIDLSDWGIGLGETIYSIRVALLNATANKEEFAAFAALNPAASEVPIPAAGLLFLFGGAGLFGASRKKLKAAKA